jgi:hypothetical protein
VRLGAQHQVRRAVDHEGIAPVLVDDIGNLYRLLRDRRRRLFLLGVAAGKQQSRRGVSLFSLSQQTSASVLPKSLWYRYHPYMIYLHNNAKQSGENENVVRIAQCGFVVGVNDC